MVRNVVCVEDETETRVEVVVLVWTVGLARRYDVEAPSTTVSTTKAARAADIPVRDIHHSRFLDSL